MNNLCEPTLFYEDGILPMDHPLREQAERAYRDAFLNAAKQAVVWTEPDVEAIDAARHARTDARFASVTTIERGQYYHTPDHVIAAARTRGRHHALEFVCQAWDRDEAQQHDMPTVLQRWLGEVIHWANGTLDEMTIPPNPDDNWEHSPGGY